MYSFTHTDIFFLSRHPSEIVIFIKAGCSRYTIQHFTSNDSRFIHKLYPSLHAMYRLARGETAYIALKTLQDNLNWA